jgi:signal transduction histidine kinase
MLSFEAGLAILLVYFVYGLAFFSMGIALSLETWRSSRLAERRVLRPLALFGLLHGAYEWFEIFILQAEGYQSTLPDWFAWVRVGWLSLSFIPLFLFGILGLNRSRVIPYFELYFAGSLGFFLLFLTLVTLYTSLPVGGVLVRYLLAVPGAGLAAAVLISRARSLHQEGRESISRCFLMSGVGFGLYGITQVFVPGAMILPASLVNESVFLSTFGIPVQALRAGLALLITINLLLAIQLAERERSEQLLTAQQERLKAMERVQEELILRESMRRELLRHTVMAQEEERARIARELHDETAQILTAFSLDLATLRTLLKKRSHEVEIIDRLLNLGRQMSKGLYRLVHDLRPAQLDDLGLVPALQHLTGEARYTAQLEVQFQVNGVRQRLDPVVETVLFRVAQEALTNVTRHAGTASARVELTFEPNRIILRVQDEGKGFDQQDEFNPPQGWGLVGMRERADSVGGALEIRSALNSGTEIVFSVPITAEKALYAKEIVYGNG